jgi:hypothetical protein
MNEYRRACFARRINIGKAAHARIHPQSIHPPTNPPIHPPNQPMIKDILVI